MRVLIIANSRYKGGLSGSDAIYENFKKHWPCEVVVKHMVETDYRPFLLCYLERVVRGTFAACLDCVKYDFVYSASDFLPDALPALVYKIKGVKWVAGFYLQAFKENWRHRASQNLVRQLIERFADMVIVANPTMLPMFHVKRKTWINGGVDLHLCEGTSPKIYDAVFCGRIHPSKGIDQLLDIWQRVRRMFPSARLAVIGDGDMGKNYIDKRILVNSGIHALGYMGEERYEIYKQSKIVLYPTPPKFDHFSMAPVEAMACGCPCISFDTATIRYMNPKGWVISPAIGNFVLAVVELIRNFNGEKYRTLSRQAKEWAINFDYKKESLRIYETMKKELFDENSDDRGAGDGRNGHLQNSQWA